MNNIDYKKDLNPEQLEVVLHGDGPCLVLAGAGSGKTRTITYRVAYLLEQGINPEEILLLTFTNKAAKEMLGRVEALIGFPSPYEGEGLGARSGTGEGGKIFGGTFHSVANRILRSYASFIGRSNNFSILDEDDSKALIKLALKESGADNSRDKRFPSPAVFQSLYSYVRNSGLSLAVVLEQRNSPFFSSLSFLERTVDLYEQKKKNSDALDFDDLLLLLLRLLEKNPEVCQRLAERFHYVLVDEYQDTNILQAKIVYLLSSVHQNLLVVGDDAQSIYSFRAAEIKNILDFSKIYPEAKIFRLTANYRSVPTILSMANAIIKNNTNQFKKDLQAIKKAGKKPKLYSSASVMEEAKNIADEITRLRATGIPAKEIAVLFRAAFLAQPLEYELMKRNCLYEFRGGLRFFERAHIKDVIAHLKVLSNTKDEAAWLRVLGLYPGIGAATAGKIIEQIKDQENLSDVVAGENVSTGRAASGWELCRGVLRRVVALKQPAEIIRTTVAQGYRDYLEAEYPDFRDRLDDLEQFALFAESVTDLRVFLDEVTLAENFGLSRDEQKERIVLSTIHQAKGLEWDVVFVIGLREGAFPNQRALAGGEIEEERRLFYVATTRAREHLYLTYSLTDGRGNDFSFGQPSMFLEELPSGLWEESKKKIGHYSDNFFNDEAVIVLDELGEPPSSQIIKNKKGFLRELDEL